EFQPFVVVRAAAAVRQRLLEKRGSREAVPEALFQSDLLASGGGRVVDVEAHILNERHLLAVGKGDGGRVAILADVEVARLERGDVVDVRAVLEGAADFGRGRARQLSRDGL